MRSWWALSVVYLVGKAGHHAIVRMLSWALSVVYLIWKAGHHAPVRMRSWALSVAYLVWKAGHHDLLRMRSWALSVVNLVWKAGHHDILRMRSWALSSVYLVWKAGHHAVDCGKDPDEDQNSLPVRSASSTYRSRLTFNRSNKLAKSWPKSKTFTIVAQGFRRVGLPKNPEYQNLLALSHYWNHNN